MCDIAKNLANVLENIKEAEKKANRKAGSVKLMAVSKMHAASCVIQALKAGQVLFGENRVQEAKAKFMQIKEDIKEQNLSLPRYHLAIIGQLQLNKVKYAVQIADSIHSVDRFELLQAIYTQAAKQNKKIKIFFELHTAEDTKSGFSPQSPDIKTCLDFCCSTARDIVIPQGFMTIAPNTQDQEAIKQAFLTARQVRDTYQEQYKELDLRELSCGMSGDYKLAIQEGSTIVRIGTAIFGQRASFINL